MDDAGMKDCVRSTAPRSAQAIARALRDAREYTLSIYADLTPAQRVFPLLDVVNPPVWELGHIGWFQEFWCLRHAFDDPRGVHKPSRIADADKWWDSARVPHDSRWTLPLPDWNGVRAYLDATLDATLDALARRDDGDFYAFELALYHEDMHAEALVMSLQTLALPASATVVRKMAHASERLHDGDESFAGGTLAMGARHGDERRRFVFDNEKWVHDVDVRPFAMSRAPVSHAQFAAFVDDAGYERADWWSGAGRAWLERTPRRAPAHWRRGAHGWQVRRFDRWLPLPTGEPVVHVNAFEAEAWCRWAGRRLPTEAEWEWAATHGGAALPGAVWEWTASAFTPYPGFAADRYAEYSEPWFHTHRVLRGGSWATQGRLVHPRFRNFYEPRRRDPIAGFRSCAARPGAAAENRTRFKGLAGCSPRSTLGANAGTA